ncbi:PstS family phosphate ABC transporter substrate-binding protein [Virgibacillus sp. MSJ-26]|uniref:PstS family phosphate ABC transporter substrate-binding protein n=1 Tax=Virgibacillus sp. MSJ-26 TaxID=2841522 RepID=UPI001C1103F8|nr:PstS family phosphate ABC transporter substrate-binding protein [Virgibacillus sp. MSJ-26]MBU5466187.1 PstS family phosphate ABC transporter substrate-binding protein [Virgibacillus sp. MSJ-26]
MNTKKYLAFFMLILTVVVSVACNSNSEEASKSDSSQAAELDGSIVIDGSGTVYPLMAQLAEEYMLTEQENVSIEVSRAGTSAGFKKFLTENGSDFNNASREIKEEEIENADTLNIETKEFKVALDGLTFVIHPDNDWATELTKDQIISIFKADSDISKWSDLDPDFPDEKIQPYGPNENHGTYEFFWENILEEKDLVSTTNLQQEYSTLVNLISEDINGIAFFGYGYYASNQDTLKAVNVDFGDGPVEPSLDTIAEDGDYAPFTRPVFTYLNIQHAKEKPQVLDYAKFVVNNINNFASETGFAPLPEDEITEYVQFLDELKQEN